MKKENNDKLVRKYLSSDFDISTIPRSQRNTLNNLQDIKTTAKKHKKKTFKYTSLDYNEGNNNKKSNEICTIDKVRRYSSVNYAFDSKRKKKKTLISNYYEDNADLESKILKDIKDRLKNHKERLSKKKKNLNPNDDNNNNINNNTKSKFGKNIIRHPRIHTEKNMNFFGFRENRLKLCNKIKNSKSPYHTNNNINTNNNVSNNEKDKDDDNQNNFEDNNYISHPLKIEKKEKEHEQMGINCFTVKSTKVISKRNFFLVKEADRDYQKQITRDIKSAKKNSKNSKKKKKKKRHFTVKHRKLKLTDKKPSKEISDFCDSSKKIKRDLNDKDLSPNIFRKCNKYNESNIHINRYRSKKSSEFLMNFDMNKKESKENKESKEKQYKLKSSITLIKNPLNKKSIENQKGNHYKRHPTRRHTIFAVNDKQKNSIFNEKKRNNNNNKSINKEINGLCLNYDYDDNGYIDDCSSKNESMDEKVTKMKMKIDKITEDKLEIIKIKMKL